MNISRVEEAYVLFERIWGEEEPDSEHPAVLYLDDVLDVLEMAKASANYESDEKYLIALYAYGAGYMIGYREGSRMVSEN